MNTLKEHLNDQLRKNTINEDKYERQVEEIISKLSDQFGEPSDRDGTHYGKAYVNTYYYELSSKTYCNIIKDKLNDAVSYGLYDAIGDGFVLFAWLSKDGKTLMIDIVEKDQFKYIDDGSSYPSVIQYEKAHEKDLFVDILKN